MLFSVSQYEWELEGDFAASVFLDLQFDADCDNDRLRSLELVEIDVNCITFQIRDAELACEGPKGLRMPDAFLDWIAKQFGDEWDRSEDLRELIREKYEQKAINQYWEARQPVEV